MAAQHSTLLVPSDHSRLLLVASLCLLLFRRWRVVALFLGAYALFMLEAGDIIGNRLQATYAGDSMLTSVRIAEPPRISGDSITMRVEPLDDQRIPPRVRVSWFDPPHVPVIGEIWELELRLQRPRGTSNPGVFDYESWLFREKFHATGYVVSGQRNRLLWSGTMTGLERFRQSFTKRALAAAGSRETAGVLAAVGVGERHLISREQWDGFAISGTSHLMAISGLHVGLAALTAFLLSYLFLAALPGRHNAYIAALVAGLGFALAYALVSGFGVPARRAVIMLSVAAVTLLRRRQVDRFICCRPCLCSRPHSDVTSWLRPLVCCGRAAGLACEAQRLHSDHASLVQGTTAAFQGAGIPDVWPVAVDRGDLPTIRARRHPGKYVGGACIQPGDGAVHTRRLACKCSLGCGGRGIADDCSP
jgi:ComEC/Rec2-related protein